MGGLGSGSTESINLKFTFPGKKRGEETLSILGYFKLFNKYYWFGRGCETVANNRMFIDRDLQVKTFYVYRYFLHKSLMHQ